MKKQFLHEHHNRQDKAQKEDYRPSMVEKASSPVSWSGINHDKLKDQLEARKLEIRKARTMYFVYGEWLFQHTRKISHFAFLNKKNQLLTENDLRNGFALCSQSFEKDFARISDAIKKAPVVHPKGLPRWFPKTWVVNWEMPQDLIATEVVKKVPERFRHNVDNASTNSRESADSSEI